MEYVPKSELKNFKKEFHEAIKYVRKELSFKFSFQLVGSSKRNLVLRHHNKGFDLDYQIIYDYKLENSDLKSIKSSFMDCFNHFFGKLGYSNAEDSTSAITIKKVDENAIIQSYDIVLISRYDGVSHIVKYADNEKTRLVLNELKHSKIYNEKYKTIKGYNMWNDLRERYKEKKENNKEIKKSYSLLAEVVKEMFDLI